MKQKICILGLGYIGLPMACVLAGTGFEVVGVDIDENVIESIQTNYINNPEPGLGEAVDSVVEQNNFELSNYPLKSDVYMVCVGTPLTNDKKLITLAKSIDRTLRENHVFTTYDDGGSIGRRYARMDEIGTPFCITIDFDSLTDAQVTIRDRDTTDQKRISIDDVPKFIQTELSKK